MITVHYGRNTGSGAGSDTMTLPTAGSQKHIQANIEMKYNLHQIALTDVVLQASKRSKEFLVSALENEYEGAKSDMQRQLSRQGYGVGTGELFRISGAHSGATTITVDTPMVGKNPTDFIEEGNEIAIGSGTGTILTVSSILGPNSFTVTTSLTASGGEKVYLASASSQSNKDYEIMGLKGLIDDSSLAPTLQGLSRSTYTWWKSYVDENSGTTRSLTDSLLQDTWVEAQKKGVTKYILTSWDVQNAYGQLLSPDRRYVKGEMKLNGGFSGVEFNGVPMVADYDAPYTDAFFIDPSTLSVEEIGPMSFMNEDGNILSRSATQPAWNATLRYYANLCIKAPNKNAKLSDVTK